MSAIVVIPARMASTRFPGKPLVNLCGSTMIERVWKLAKAAKGIDEVYVATEDPKLADFVKSFGGEAVLTSDSCANGTERVANCLEVLNIQPEVIINFQGDAPLTPPWIISDLAAAMLENSEVNYATPACRLGIEEYQELLESKRLTPSSGTLVVFDKNYDSMYFSSSLIPFHRTQLKEPLPIFKHIGMYAYRTKSLFEYVNLKPTTLELVEGLEQLRLLENGLKLKVVPVDYKGKKTWSIDNPTDVAIVEQIIKTQGELLG